MGRWDYMAREGYNPPCGDCPECSDKGLGFSRIWRLGGKRFSGEQDGESITSTRWKCDRGHIWVVLESKKVSLEGS